MLETLIVIAIVAAAAVFLALRLLRPLWKKDSPATGCDLCSSPCAEKNRPETLDLSCSAGTVPNPLRQNVPGPRPDKPERTADEDV